MANGLFDKFNPLMSVPTNQHGIGGSLITKGTLVSFDYPQSYAMIPNIIHDVRPMIIVTDIWKPNWIRGVNLHYLDFKYVRWLLTNYGGNPNFSYSHIAADKYYMAKAFRMYAWKGVKRPRKLDTEWLKQVLTQVRSFDPGEVEKIRATIQKQIQTRLQAKAKELTSYEAWRKQLSNAQKNQLRTKVSDIHQMLTRGPQEGLIKPAPGQVGPDQAVESDEQNM